MDKAIFEYLSSRNIRIPNTDFYSLIDIWNEWYKGENEYHHYKDSEGRDKTMYCAGMAKQIAEDWASISITERDAVTTKAVINGKEKVKLSKKSTEYLQKELRKMNFYRQIILAIEKCAALGTIGASLKVKDAKLVNNEIVATPKTRTSINYINAKQIVPLRVENGEIKDVAFISKELVGDETFYYIEMHIEVYDENSEKLRYKIENVYIDSQGKEVEKDGVIKEFYVDVPFFAILKTPIGNPYDEEYEDIGFGMSMFSNAISQLKTVDTIYNNFVMDFFLGGKKVFYNRKITNNKVVQVKQKDGTIKEEVRTIYPDDVTRQQFQILGDDLNISKDELLKEYNPELRVSDNTTALQFALDLLSFKCKLGSSYYKIDKKGNIVTATQYIGDRKDLVDNANKFRIQVNEFISRIGKAILFVGRILFNAPVSEECEIELEDSDGFMVDTETAKNDFRMEVAQGLRMPYEYRMRFFKESEEEAKAILGESSFDDVKIDEEDEVEE